MKTMSVLNIAARNLKRHVRRSVLSATSIALAAGLLFFTIGFYRGTYTEMTIESVIRFKTNHVIVHTPAFNEKDPSTWIDSASLLHEYKDLVSWFHSLAQTRGVSVHLHEMGYAGNGQEKYPVMVTGVDPKTEPSASIVPQNMVAGAYLDSADGLVMGRELAELFELKIGDACLVQAQTTHGTPNLETLTLTGIYNTGFSELDRNTVFIRLESAQRLFDTPGAANRISVLLKETPQTAAVVEAARSRVGSSLTVNPWEKYAQGILWDAEADKLFYDIMIAILILISVSSISGTMSMSVIERTREIGTLRANGWFRSEIIFLFLSEAAILGVIGSVAGLLLFTPLIAYMTITGFDLAQVKEAVSIPVFRMICRPEWQDTLIAFGAGMAATFAGGFLPARRAGNLPVVDCLKNI